MHFYLPSLPIEKRHGVFMPVKPEFLSNPFFHMLTETGVAAMFLRAVESDPDQARTLLSKNCVMDLEAFRDVLDSCHCGSKFVTLKKGSAISISERMRTILFGNLNCVLHFYMVEEPDIYGRWKVFGVEKE